MSTEDLIQDFSTALEGTETGDPPPGPPPSTTDAEVKFVGVEEKDRVVVDGAGVAMVDGVPIVVPNPADFYDKPTAKDWIAAVRDVVLAGKDVAPEISKNLSLHLDSYDTILTLLDRSPEEVSKVIGLLSQLTGVPQTAPAPAPVYTGQPIVQPVQTAQVGQMVTCEQMVQPHPTTTCSVQGGHSGSVAVAADMLAGGPPLVAMPPVATPANIPAVQPIAQGGPAVGLGSNGPPSPAVGNWMQNSGMNPGTQFDSEMTRATGMRKRASYGDKQPGGGPVQQLVSVG